MPLIVRQVRRLGRPLNLRQAVKCSMVSQICLASSRLGHTMRP